MCVYVLCVCVHAPHLDEQALRHALDLLVKPRHQVVHRLACTAQEGTKNWAARPLDVECRDSQGGGTAPACLHER